MAAHARVIEGHTRVTEGHSLVSRHVIHCQKNVQKRHARVRKLCNSLSIFLTRVTRPCGQPV